MEYVRDLRPDELHRFSFASHNDLERFVIEVCARSSFDYEVISERSAVVPESVAKWFSDRIRELGLLLVNDDPSLRRRARPRKPSRAAWDAFMHTLEQDLATEAR